jgi:hypothetical protein
MFKIEYDDMTVTGNIHGIELQCMFTGEIFDVPSIASGRALRAKSVREQRLAYDFAMVRNNVPNGPDRALYY